MNLFIIKAYNKSGGCIGTYHVAATGVNRAKSLLREREPRCKKVEVERVVYDLIVEAEEDAVLAADILRQIKSYIAR